MKEKGGQTGAEKGKNNWKNFYEKHKAALWVGTTVVIALALFL